MDQIKHWNQYDKAGIGVGAYTDIESLTALVKERDILEVGCGRGLMLSNLISAKKRSGIDPSSEAIEFAKTHIPEANLQVAFAQKLPFEDNTFDLVYSLEVIEHVKEYELMVSEVERVLKPGGIIFIQTPNYPIKRFYDLIFWAFGKRLELADDYTHVSKLSSFKLRSVLKKKFNLVDVYSRNIFLDSRLRFLKGNFFKRKLGLLVGQKTIVVGTKKERS